jgi:hypothetical protein
VKAGKAYHTVSSWGCRRYRECWHALVASVVAAVLYHGSETTWTMEHTQHERQWKNAQLGVTCHHGRCQKVKRNHEIAHSTPYKNESYK